MLVSTLSENIRDRLEQSLTLTYMLCIRIEDSFIYFYFYFYLFYFRLRISVWYDITCDCHKLSQTVTSHGHTIIGYYYK